MFERIKDFIYDIRDIILVIAIIAILVLSVTWKIGTTMELDIETQVVVGPQQEETSSAAPLSTPPTTPFSPVPSTTATTTTTSTRSEVVVFHVREGEYSQTIAKNLFDEGLIENTDAFLIRAHEMGVDTSLRIGIYELKRTDDMETILRILSGGSR